MLGIPVQFQTLYSIWRLQNISLVAICGLQYLLLFILSHPDLTGTGCASGYYFASWVLVAISQVFQHVLYQVLLQPVVLLLAEDAAVGLLPGVNSNVDGELALAAVLLHAVLATERRRLPAVDDLVVLR